MKVIIDGVEQGTGTGGGGGSTTIVGATAFTDLTDAPSTIVANQFLKGNAGGNALEFAALAGGGDMLASTYDPTNVAADAFDYSNFTNTPVSSTWNHNDLTNTHNLTTDIAHSSISGTHNLTSDIVHSTITGTHNLTTDIDHDSLTNTHNLTTDINHNSLTSTHNLTTDIDHNQLTNYSSTVHFPMSSITITESQVSDLDKYDTSTVDSLLSAKLFSSDAFDGSYSTLTDVPLTFAPSAHTQAYSTLTDVPTSFTPSAHTQAYSTLTDVPTSFTPSAHTQFYSTITDFDTGVAANSAVALNTAKITNQTHTGHVTGSGALTIASSVIAPSHVSATGTPSSTTFWRGDNVWGAPTPGAHTQLASTITDFDTAVTANSTVAANTAKITNQTHTGHVTGSAALTLASSVIAPSHVSATGTASSTTYWRGDNTWSTPAGGTTPVEFYALHSDAGAGLTMTNQAAALQFCVNANRNVALLDLSNYTQIRFVNSVVTSSASASTPILRILYKDSYSGTASTYSTIGATDVSTSLAGSFYKDTGWINLVAGAKTSSCYVAFCAQGGDAAADPVVGRATLMFK
jgi:hypothetical protein